MKTITLFKNEQIRDVVGYEGIYKITSFGRVISLYYNNTNKIKELTQIISNKGYHRLGISKPNSKRVTVTVHRLVARAFLENIDNKSQINHKDGNKSNNNINNLEWCTPSENVKHSIETKLRLPRHGYLRGDNKSGYVGVDFHKVQNKWQARIQVNKKRIRIGFYDTALEASKAYVKYMEDNNIKKFIKKTNSHSLIL